MDNLLGPILGFLLGIPITYIFVIFKERYESARLTYEKVSSLSLAPLNEGIKGKIALTYDGMPINNIFSFRVKITNGRIPIKEVPIIFEFPDTKTEIVDIKANFKTEDKVKFIETFQDKDKKNQERVIIKPGLDKNEKVVFDIFTIIRHYNRNIDFASLKIILGKIQGIEWREKKEKIPVTPKFILFYAILLYTSLSIFMLSLAYSEETYIVVTALKVVGIVLATGAAIGTGTLIILWRRLKRGKH